MSSFSMLKLSPGIEKGENFNTYDLYGSVDAKILYDGVLYDKVI